MKIESRVSDIAQEIQLKEFPGSAASRQRSVTSGSKGDSPREPIVSKAGLSQDKAEKTKSSEPVSIDVHKAIEKLNKFVEAQKKDVSFSVDKASESQVIKVFKTQTGELIKQFPAEQILAMRARIRNNTGLLFDSKM